MSSPMFAVTLCVVLLLAAQSYGQEEVWPRTINITVVNSQDNNQCPLDEERERGRNDIQTEVRSILAEYVEDGPFYDCNGTPGWKRVVFINMNDTSYNCPPGLNLTEYSKRTCGRSNSEPSCSSTTFSVRGSEYSRVCGRMRGYQVGATSAFWGYLMGSQSLEGYYIDGVSLTHGPDGGRQHIWTFAAGHEELSGGSDYEKCPCDTANDDIISPPFVGNDYFCESGINHWSNIYLGEIFPDDPLWDGQGCSSTSTCCEFNNPPWFTKNLPNPTTDDIELRVCSQHVPSFDDTALELIELYVK